ncbi:MAG TPA: type II secretion system protein N [Rubrivivax sp.]|nr:type II secretion system protein N [Rubrivivax sp.]
MLPRVLAFVVWALVAAGAAAWSLKLFSKPLQAPAETVIATSGAAQGGDWARLFGAVDSPAAAPAPTPLAPAPGGERFRLLGVAAPRSQAAGAEGVALISVDGKPARALRVGAVVDGDQVLQRVEARAASIGPRGGPSVLRLELPPLPPPATGVPGSAQAPAPRPPLPGMSAALPATAPAVHGAVMAMPADGSTAGHADEAGVTESAPGVVQGMPPQATPSASPQAQRQR